MPQEDQQEIKFVFIARGIPGSGKTTFAKLLYNTYSMMLPDFTVYHAIDDLHTDESGEFLWDEDLEEERYNKLFSDFKESCDTNKAFIIVDAMNLQKKDYMPYVKYAEMAGYSVTTVVPPQPSAKEAAKRNKHFVTKEQIEEMITRWEG